ncbi:MAG: 4'-phosphopantetheinyl transferase superfamily protein [Bacteroidetes bacterium]|nr:4'-phosphopantetheinyl transferase superfamily protein [Bacteroidota bacterium]
MGLYYIEKNADRSVLAIWEQQDPVLRGEKRAREQRSVHSLLRIVFGADQVLNHRPNGQPFLMDNPAHISIAHTNRFTALLTHPQKRAGVDIESLNRNFSAVEQRALSDREIGFLGPDSVLRSLQLGILWSAKEAIFKCLSREGVDFSRQIQVEPFVSDKSGNLNAHFYGKDGCEIALFLKYRIIDNHILVYVFV